MDHFELANQSPNDLKDVFTIVANEKKLNVALIEKDFWVTVMLKYLFTKSPWKNKLLFKGGTCLSKCYGAIKRFSEDIDIVLDWRELNYGISGPEIRESRKQKEKVNDDLIKRSDDFIKLKFIPVLEKELSEIFNFKFSITYPSTGNVIFKYPSIFSTTSVKSEILIEIGPRGTWKNSAIKYVSSYISEMQPELCSEKIPVLSTSLERAFCEKLLIIHTVAYSKKISDRYSRHYYDIHSIFKTMDLPSLNDIIKDTVEFKKRFFPGNYGYDTMYSGNFLLMVPDEILGEFISDYKSMEEMIFDDIPSIDEIINSLKIINTELNRYSNIDSR